MTIPLILMAAMAAGPAEAQTGAARQAAPVVDVDARWAPWLGCWRLDDDPGMAELRVCITPDGASGVTLDTLVGAQRGAAERMTPDGSARAVSENGCRGTERAEWSADGQRVFRASEVTCGAEGARKLVTVSFLSRGAKLVRVQAVDAGGARSVRVVRYSRAGDQTLADGRQAPQPLARRLAEAPAQAEPWSVDDVIEASGKLPAEAVQAALVEVDAPFTLNRKTLVALADGGVQPGVIDLMVALTYPKKLAVASPSTAGGGALPLGGWYDPFFSPIIPAAYFFADCYSPFSYDFLSPCSAYGSYGNYRFWPYSHYGSGYYPNNWVVVDSTGGQAPQGEGKVVNGRGYTQVRRLDPSQTTLGASRGSSSGSSDGSAMSGTSSASSSGVSSGGYSGGSAGGGGGRTAVPRP